MKKDVSLENLSLRRKKIVDVLLEKNIITTEILSEAVKIQNSGDSNAQRSLPEILTHDCGVDRDVVYREIARYYAFPIIDLAEETVEPERLAFIRKTFDGLPAAAQELAMKYRVLPFKLAADNKDKLLVLTTDPTKREIYLIARFFPYRTFQVCYISLTQWEEIWEELRGSRKEYPGTAESGGGFEIKGEESDALDEERIEEEIEEEINRSKLVDLIERMLVEAARVGASDIHVLPRGPRTTEFRFRIDGKLVSWYSADDVRAEAIAAVVKDQAKNLDRFERNTAQDGFAQMIVDGEIVRYRFSVLPLVGREIRNKYESIVIRVLQEPRVSVNLSDLGFDRFSESVFKKAITKPHGLVVVTGPTGSGKSTTLVSSLRVVISPELNVITVEDPVEYLIEGARQVKLNPKLNFEGALRAILRHDPDIVMVGEIRDRTTADIAIKLANTGHLTFSTLHTNDAPSAIARLYKMGVEPFLIAYAINIILAQRLVRKLCPRCKTPTKEIDTDVLKKLDFPDKEIKETTFYRPVGCNRCIRGYKGRTAIYEALYFSKTIRRMILQASESIDEESIRQQALKEGMQTLRMSALGVLKEGITTLDEVVSTTSED
jgi:type IV pilus assembly protein PilB